MQYPNRLIKIGETDKNIVKAIQSRLNEVGVSSLNIDGDFGRETQRAVKLFQARNFDQLGNPLVVDGIIGKITHDILFGGNQIQIIPNITPYLTAVIEIARTQIGVLEQPLYSNSGTEVDAYLRSTNLGPGYAWCMAFVYWCFQTAAERVNHANPLVNTAGCLNQWNKTTLPKITKDQAVNNPNLIKPGSVFIMNFGRGLGHTGIVESIVGGFVNTIEGNTNTSQSRAGIGVYRTTRKINSINKGFILPE